MKIEISTVKKLEITELGCLDPVNVILEDHSPGRGKMTIECYSESWTHYWSGMGGKKVAEFFLGCDNGYLSGKFIPHVRAEIPETSRGVISKFLRKEIIKMRRNLDIDSVKARELYDASAVFFVESDGNNHDLYAAVFGGEWWHLAPPMQENRQYGHFQRILDAVRGGLKEMLEQEGESNG